MRIEQRKPLAWKTEVLEALQHLGNIEEQPKALVGTDDCFFPAPSELYAMLIEDADFEAFIQLLLEDGFHDLAAAGQNLFLRLQSFPDEKFNDASIFKDSGWIGICASARKLASDLAPIQLT